MSFMKKRLYPGDLNHQNHLILSNEYTKVLKKLINHALYSGLTLQKRQITTRCLGLLIFITMQLRHLFASLALGMSTLLLSGCDLTLSNLTAQKMPQNPSGLYTIAVDAEIKDPAIDEKNLRLDIVIDGQTHPMEKSTLYPRIFEYDYRMPKDRNEAKYYVIATYDVERNGTIRPHSKTSELYTIALTNRYVISLETSRGPVGATIGAVGRGFTKFDRVAFNDTEAETFYHSANALSFRVPLLPASRTYNVILKTGNGELSMGTFRIDPASIHAQPSRLLMNSGERSLIVFSIRSEAPVGGIPLDITTDIPDGVIMPEATLPGGARSISVPLEGGRPGHGTLFINAPGFTELQVPVDVLGDMDNYTSTSSTPIIDNQPELITPNIPWQPLND